MSVPNSSVNQAALLAAQSQVVGTTVFSGTNYTLVLSDAGKVIETTGGNVITITIPTNASVPFPVGTVIEIFQAAYGQPTIAGASGVTLLYPATGGLKVAVQYASVSIRQRAIDSWVVSGYTSA